MIKIGADDVTVRDLTVLDAPRAGIATSGTAGVTVEHVRVVGSGSFAIYGDSSKRDLGNFTVADNLVDRRASGRRVFEGGIKVHHSGPGRVHDVTISGNTVFLPHHPLDDRATGIETWNGVQHATITGNRVNGGSMGISLDATDASTVRANDVRGFRLHAVELAGSAGDVVDRNHVVCPPVGAARGVVSDGAGGRDSTISRNAISGCKGPAIQLKPHSDGSVVSSNSIVEPGPYAVEIFESPRSKVTANVLDGASRGRFGVAVVACNDVSVTGNRISRFTKAGVLLWAPRAASLRPERIAGNWFVAVPTAVQERLADLDHSD